MYSLFIIGLIFCTPETELMTISPDRNSRPPNRCNLQFNYFMTIID